MTGQGVPASWIDTVALGDLKAGVETLEAEGVDGETGLALVWLAAAPASQRQTGFVVELRDVEHNGRYLGHWKVVVHATTTAKEPDPAQRLVLVEDGQRVWDVARALDSDVHTDPLHKAQGVALALLVGRAYPTKGGIWRWSTPLGRRVSVLVQQDV